jgi:hypothetical protein
VIIDGEVKDILEISTRYKQYELVTGLAAGEHMLELVKRNFNGIATFSGLVLDDGAMVSAPASAKHHIEFIGDSYTSAYGNEAPTSDCTWKEVNLLTNAYKGYASITARAVGADYTVLAFPGGGFFHNKKDTVMESVKPVPAYYEQALRNDTTANPVACDLSNHHPDLIVLALGINDLNDKNFPVTEDTFNLMYHRAVDNLEARHPGVQILCMAFDWPRQLPEWAKKVVDEKIAAGRKNIHFVSAGSQTAPGCHQHPGLAAHQNYATIIVPVIQDIYKNVPGNGTTGVHDLQGMTFPVRKNGQAAWYDITGRKVRTDKTSGNPQLIIKVTDNIPGLQLVF